VYHAAVDQTQFEEVFGDLVCNYINPGRQNESFQEIERKRLLQRVLEHLEHFDLRLDDLPWCVSVGCDVCEVPDYRRVHVFVFRCEQHRRYTAQLQFVSRNVASLQWARPKERGSVREGDVRTSKATPTAATVLSQCQVGLAKGWVGGRLERHQAVDRTERYRSRMALVMYKVSSWSSNL
jgi:hypothetical protein